MSALEALPFDEIIARGRIDDADVLAIRAAVYTDGSICAQDAESLFKLNEACTKQCPAWTDLFIEALTDYVVHQSAPEGYTNVANAEWLIERISKDGRVDSRSELELLVNVLSAARWSPSCLVQFAMEQVKHAVISGDGPLRDGSSLDPHSISEAEVELLRRMLYSFGGDGNIAITRAEAETLFEINDALGDREPNGAWTDMFVKAVANALMAYSGYDVPTREEALRREAWLQDCGELSLANIVKSMATSSLDSIKNAYREQTAEERALARLERQRIEIITAETVTQSEAEWLADRIGADGKLSLAEEALVAFLIAESPNLHPVLQDRITELDRAA